MLKSARKTLDTDFRLDSLS